MSWLFNAMTERLDLAAAPVTDYPMTVAFWIKPANLDGTAGRYFGQLHAGNETTHFWRAYINTGTANDLPPRATITSGYNINGPASPRMTSTSQWYHVTIRLISATSRYLYLNGTAGSQGTSIVVPATPNALVLGNSRLNTSDYLNGRMAHVAMWSTDIGATAITALAGGANPLAYPSGLAAYWPMNTDELAPSDASGNGYTLTVTGATYDADNPTVDAAATKYVKLLASLSAASATGIEGVVLNSTRDTVIGEFTGQAFEDDLESGEAVLLIPVADITPDGATLTTSDAPIVFAYNSTDGTVGEGIASVIEV